MQPGKLKLRIKNKYIIIGATIIVLSLVAIRVLGGDYLFYKARKAAHNHDRIKALAHYDAFIEQYPQHKKVAEALFRSADLFEQSAQTYSAFSPGYFTTHSVSRTHGSITDLTQASLTQEERYLLALELNPSRWLADIIDYKLAQIYWQSGDLRSEELFLKILYDHDDFCPTAAACLIEFYLRQNKIEQAREIADYWQLKEPEDETFHTYLGDIYLEEGQYDLARQAYEKSNYARVSSFLTFSLYFAKDSSDRKTDRKEIMVYGEDRALIEMRSYAENRELYLEKLASADSFTGVKGVVTLDGKPLPGIKVKANFKDRQLYNPYTVFRITDEEGMFSGKLPADSYESINIVLDSRHMSLVEGKYLQLVERESAGQSDGAPAEHEVCFHFKDPMQLKEPVADFVYEGKPFLISWEPHPTASEYELGIWLIMVSDCEVSCGVSWSSFKAEKIKTRACDYLLQVDLLDIPFHVSPADEVGVTPEGLIRRAEAFDGISIIIEALDEAGNVIISSQGLNFIGDEWNRNEFPMAKSLRNPGEQMLVERRYDEAVDYFERRRKENPDDTDSLWVLASVYFHGTHDPEPGRLPGSQGFNRENFAHKDFQKALEVLQDIQKIEPGSKVDSALEIVERYLKSSKAD